MNITPDMLSVRAHANRLWPDPSHALRNVAVCDELVRFIRLVQLGHKQAMPPGLVYGLWRTVVLDTVLYRELCCGNFVDFININPKHLTLDAIDAYDARYAETLVAYSKVYGAPPSGELYDGKPIWRIPALLAPSDAAAKRPREEKDKEEEAEDEDILTLIKLGHLKGDRLVSGLKRLSRRRLVCEEYATKADQMDIRTAKMLIDMLPDTDEPLNAVNLERLADIRNLLVRVNGKKLKK